MMAAGRLVRWLPARLRNGWPVLLAAALVWLVSVTPWWRSVEWRVFDRLTVYAAPNQVKLPITIIAIDEESLAKIKQQWPWPRGLHAQLLRRLTEAGVAVVAFDVLFPEAAANPQDDADFADAIRHGPPVILAADLQIHETAGARVWQRVEPVQALRDAGGKVSFAAIELDRDGGMRRMPRGQDAFWRQTLLAFDHRIPGVVGRLDALPDQHIRYQGGPQTFLTIPYARLLDADHALSPNWKDVLRDNIVLVGRSLKSMTDVNAAQADLFITPFFQQTHELMPGVEIHANAIANMIAGDSLQELPSPVVTAAFIGMALLSTVLLAGWRPAISGVAALGLCGAAAGAETYLFLYQQRWLPAMAIAAVPLAGYLAQGIRAFVHERNRRREIRRAFSYYVAPAVVDQVIAHPERLRLGGERRELTLLFTDLAGFTSFAANMSAEAVAQLLNRHLTDMTSVVMRHGGTVDKFIGDAVMAFWGAPLVDDQQSQHAVQAADDMQRAMESLRKEVLAAGGPELHVRIGLHRGECVVGNMGGADRFDYTAVGDTVNLASRLEGANKYYGTGILLSDAVANVVRDSVSLREIDLVRVVGRPEPVALFTICDDTVLIGLTHAAQRLYHDGRFEEALAAWRDIATAYPADTLATVFIERLQGWQQNGWPIDWDGITNLVSK